MKVPSKREVVVLALADLEAIGRVADTEDVAMRAFELAPKAFAWRKYPEQVDLDSVRVSLTDACKPRYGAHVAGSLKAGWHLTPPGLDWLADQGAALRQSLTGRQPTTRPDARAETRHAASEAARVRSSEAFRDWERGTPNLSARLIGTAFRVDFYTTRRDRSLKLNRFRQIAQELEDVELARFVAEMTPVVLELNAEERREDTSG